MLMPRQVRSVKGTPMGTEVDESLVRELAEPLVGEFSPAEQGELFDLLGEAHFADPDAFASGDRAIQPLAFGLPELTVLLTPVLLAAMEEVVRYVVGNALARGAKITANGIRRLFGRRRTPEQVAEAPLVLTPEQWSEIRTIVERVALKGGVPADQAHLIAAAVVGSGHADRVGS